MTRRHKTWQLKNHRPLDPAPDVAIRAGSIWWSTWRSTSRFVHLELLDIPGRWGRIDAFGRGRVEG
jgi:hypothetical protein